MPSKDRGIAVFSVLSEIRSILGSTVGVPPPLGEPTEVLRIDPRGSESIVKLVLTEDRVSRESSLYLSEVVVDRSVTL